MNFLEQAERRHFLSVVGTAALLGAVPSLAQTRKGKSGASASNGFKPDLELELRAEPALVPIRPGPPTSVWRYRANVLKGDAQAVTNPASGYLGPIIRVHPDSYWWRLKSAGYRFLDGNVRTNAQSRGGACCNRPPSPWTGDRRADQDH